MDHSPPLWPKQLSPQLASDYLEKVHGVRETPATLAKKKVTTTAALPGPRGRYPGRPRKQAAPTAPQQAPGKKTRKASQDVHAE